MHQASSLQVFWCFLQSTIVLSTLHYQIFLRLFYSFTYLFIHKTPCFTCLKSRDSPLSWYKSSIKKTSFVNLLRILEKHISASTDHSQQGLANSLSYILQVLQAMTASYLWVFQKLQQKNTDNTQSLKSWQPALATIQAVKISAWKSWMGLLFQNNFSVL